jgi:hypothetical protein
MIHSRTAVFLEIATADLVPTAVMSGRDPVVWVSSLIWFIVQTSLRRDAAFSTQGGRFAKEVGGRSTQALFVGVHKTGSRPVAPEV